jgi:hypothetical protein
VKKQVIAAMWPEISKLHFYGEALDTEESFTMIKAL